MTPKCSPGTGQGGLGWGRGGRARGGGGGEGRVGASEGERPFAAGDVDPGSCGLRRGNTSFSHQAPGHIVLLLLVITPQWRWIPSKTPNVAPRSSQRCNPGGYLRGGVSLCASHSQPAALPNLGRLQKKLLQTRCKGRRLCPNAGAQPRGHSACVMFWGAVSGSGGGGRQAERQGEPLR